MSPKNTQDSDMRADTSAGIYSFMDIVAKQAEEYAAAHTSPMSMLLEEIELFTLTRTPYPSMLTGRVEGRFLQLMVQLSGARHIVEIGTFTGYSALAMAEKLPHDGEILTIEHNPLHAKIAQDFFDRSPDGFKITLRIGEALEVLKTLPDAKTDFVFIDADKENYSTYYRESMRILRKGGLILADNALWYGRIFDPKDDESLAMADFNELVRADDRAEKLFLTIRDGIYLIRKRVNLGG
ncbi:O-methyltransferase [Desulforhabdus amnigena]|uniref:O-methyltransferase n=1 Tax=Desulforhabdus amnigena TaxID=40218 RepID=A0A9W6CXS6_9BACT|nr:class I SAM-dependent methyltransferase [Desulforhabdus amnigena]GLI34604.1 O-methyltransferase [Desulforhabdus amnigena]